MLHNPVFWTGAVCGIAGTYISTFIFCVLLGTFLYKGDHCDGEAEESESNYCD